MDLRDLLAQLRKEHAALSAAIASLERLDHDRHRGLGRKPAAVTKIPAQDADRAATHSASGEG